MNRLPKNPTMNQLAKLQHTFQDCVLGATTPGTNAWVSASGRADPDTQLSIYSYAYRARLKEVLASDFPAMLMALGDERFNQLADEYINTYPSRYFSLRDFGRQLPSFISDLIQKNESYKEMHWLHELATFEFTLGQTFDAADATRFSEQDMATILPDAWPDLRFTLHPSVDFLKLEWNTVEMWQALTDEEPTQVTATREDTCTWLIWREQLTTRFRSLAINEQQALETLRDGGSFNDICETLSTMMNEEEVPLHAATLLKGWIAHGLISGVH